MTNAQSKLIIKDPWVDLIPAGCRFDAKRGCVVNKWGKPLRYKEIKTGEWFRKDTLKKSTLPLLDWMGGVTETTTSAGVGGGGGW